jgi:hypothetical protein
VRVGGRECGADILHANAVSEECGRIQIDAHGGQRAAPDLHVADAGDLGEFLFDDRRREIVELALAERGGSEGKDRDGLIRRVDLAVGRIAAQRSRKIGSRRIDGRLNVARGTVNVPIEAELQRNVGAAGRTG